MIANKYEFLKEFLPQTVKDIDYTHINLDTTDLSLSDVLRNINTLYPPNSKNRYSIENGELVVGVLCHSETLSPYNGVFLLIGQKDLDVNIISCNYIVLYIDESRIKNEIGLEKLMDSITDFLIHNYSSDMSNLPDFYRRYVYNESELYDDYEDYVGSEY